MSSWRLRTVLAVALAAAAPGCEKMQNVNMPSASDTARLAKSNAAFGFDLYARIRSSPGNLVISPASITAALAMTWGGARGSTEKEMRAVLHLEGPRDAVMSEWGNLSRGLQDSRRPLTLRMANRLYGDKTYTFEQTYLDKTKAAYGAALEPTDFKTGFEPARRRINGWVEDQTEHRIKELLPATALNGETRLVLVNAIYFLADWEEPFEQMATYDEMFAVSPTSKKKTPMMHQMGSYRVVEADGVKVLELPYKGGDAAMLVVLPDRADGLADIEQQLTATKLEGWTRALASQNVMVSLPRFEVSPSPSMSLGSELAGLGMTSAFDHEKADFTGIANPSDPRDRLVLDKVFHKAFVRVDEKGTEAAAATAVVTERVGSAPPKALDFRADHPFVFLIVDKSTAMVLFVGRVADPTMK